MNLMTHDMQKKKEASEREEHEAQITAEWLEFEKSRAASRKWIASQPQRDDALWDKVEANRIVAESAKVTSNMFDMVHRAMGLK